MEDPEEWVLHPHRCPACNHATYLRECWSDGSGKVTRRVRHEPIPCVVHNTGVQLGSWPDNRGIPAAVLPTSGGISYTIRGHGVTVTVCGNSNDLHNIVRVAHDVVAHPIIQGAVCLRDST
nr:MAG: hypothetical protein [Guiyang tombus-like virus 1]